MDGRIAQLVREAEQAGLVTPGKGDALARFLVQRGYAVEESLQEVGGAALIDSEQPRFVRGFHDILITIGVLVLTGGVVVSVWGALVALPIVIILSEIFVRRQRLALPSVVLSVLFVATAVSAALFILPSFETDSIVSAAMATASAGVYYWRYRTPISLAGFYFGIALLIFVATIMVLFSSTSLETAATTGDLGLMLASTLIAIGLFAVAMQYDLSDPARRTRRSDIAFWLHLGAAPLLLHALIGLLSGGGMTMAGLTETSPGLVVASVVVLMLVGLVIDRRVFVTSGLLSLGLALGTILKNRVADTLGINLSLVAIAVGFIVLAIGLFWQPLRRLLLNGLPLALTQRLPPAR